MSQLSQQPLQLDKRCNKRSAAALHCRRQVARISCELLQNRHALEHSCLTCGPYTALKQRQLMLAFFQGLAASLASQPLLEARAKGLIYVMRKFRQR